MRGIQNHRGDTALVALFDKWKGYIRGERPDIVTVAESDTHYDVSEFQIQHTDALTESQFDVNEVYDGEMYDLDIPKVATAIGVHPRPV